MTNRCRGCGQFTKGAFECDRCLGRHDTADATMQRWGGVLAGAVLMGLAILAGHVLRVAVGL